MSLLSRIFAAFALLALLAACDQKQEQTAQTEEGSTSAYQAEAPADEGDTIKAEPADYLLTCDNDFEAAVGFDAFLGDVKKAISQKDAAFISGIIADGIKSNFGGGGGKADFLKEWKLDSAPETSPFWDVMGEVLRLGGYVKSFDGASTTVIFPCTFRDLPPNNWILEQNGAVSAFDYVVVTRSDAALTDETGKTLRALENGEILQRIQGQRRLFTTHDGLKGAVDTQAIRNPVDYRAFFQQAADGKWQLSLLVAGD